VATRNWRTLRALYLQAVGATPRAALESWEHLSEAQRLVAAAIDVPELNSIDESLIVAPGADYVNVSSIDFSVYAVLDCFNVTDGIPMFPEPSGMTGRRAYLTTTGLPSEGTPTHYQRDGARLYVRGTPAVSTTLRVRVQRQMPDLSESSYDDLPVTPQQYDRALVHKAAQLYFLLHPAENQVADGDRSIQQSSKHAQAFSELVGGVKPVRVEEDRAANNRFRLTNFRVAPRSRRGR
jgi:hypothetical protein